MAFFIFRAENQYCLLWMRWDVDNSGCWPKQVRGRRERKREGVSSILAVTQPLKAKVELERGERDWGMGGVYIYLYMCACVCVWWTEGGVRFIKSDQQSFWPAQQQQAFCPRVWTHTHMHARTQMDGLMDITPLSLCNLQPPQKLHHLADGVFD